MPEKHPPSRYIYVRHTAVNGKSHVEAHLVWDADKFMAVRQTESSNLNSEQKPGAPRKARAEQITHDQYLKEKAK